MILLATCIVYPSGMKQKPLSGSVGWSVRRQLENAKDFSNWRLQISFEDSKFAPSMSVCAMWWIGVLIWLNWLYNQMDIKQKSECLSVHSKKVLGSTPKLDWKCFCKEFSRSIRSQKCCLSTNWACLLERIMGQSWQWSWESLVVIDGHFSRSIGGNGFQWWTNMPSKRGFSEVEIPDNVWGSSTFIIPLVVFPLQFSRE